MTSRSRLTASLALLLAGTLLSPRQATAESELFRHLSIEAEGGYTFPSGNLEPLLDPQPEWGVRAVSSYYGPLFAHAMLHVSRQDGAASPVPVLYAAGGAGLEWRPPRAWLPAPGLGISLNYGHVSSADVPAGRVFFMEDGESEFGFYPFFRWHVPVARTWFLSADVRYDVVLTEPEYSRMFSTHMGAGWQWK